MKRFLWGVDGVRLAGGKEEDTLVGGVRDLDGSLKVVECVEVGKVGSGDKFGGVGCGIVVSKSSERNNVEKVRFASSAAELSVTRISLNEEIWAYFSENEALHVLGVF